MVTVPLETPRRLVAIPDRSSVTSAVMLAATLTVSVLDALLPVLLSRQAQATEAVLVIEAGAAADTFTTRLMTALPNGPIAEGFVQVTNWPTAEQLNPPPDPLTNDKLAFSVSVTVIGPVADAVAMLLTISV